MTQNYCSTEVSVCFDKDNISSKKNKWEVTLLEKTCTARFELSFDFQSCGGEQEEFLRLQRFAYFNCLTHSEVFMMTMNRFS